MTSAAPCSTRTPTRVRGSRRTAACPSSWAPSRTTRILAADLRRGAGLAVGALAGIGAATLAYATLVERTAYRVREETLRVLPPGSRSLRVLHLADPHLAPWQRGRIAWLQGLAALEPDLVISTGDTLGHRDAIPAVAEALAPLSGIPGAFVHGSNDLFGPVLKNPFRYLAGATSRGDDAMPEPDLDTRALERVYADLGWLDLDDRARGIEVRGVRLELVGVHDAHHGYDRLDVATAELARVRSEAAWSEASTGPAVTIGLTHSPYRRILDAYVDEGVQVVFAGHTHGGQVRVPGRHAIVANCDVPLAQASGLSTWQHGGRSAHLQVSQGIGTSIYAPFRLGTPPEAVLVTMEAADIG